MTDELNRKFGTGEGVRFSVGQGDLTVCNITTPGGKAQVYLQGAHVTAYEPTSEQPVIYMSPRSRFVPGSPIRGGVPVCFPWFGPRENDPAAPAHGFARILPWKAADVIRDGDVITLSMQLDSDENTRRHWPFEFRAICRVTVAAHLQIELEIVNWSDRSFEFTEALHSYFTVKDVRNIAVTGLEKMKFIDKVAGGLQEPAGKEIYFEGETDRVYIDTTDTCVIDDPGMNRRIEIAKAGSKSTVIWNPHVKKSAALSDLGEDTWPGFVCVETANALDNKVNLKPGDMHVMSQMIRVLKA